MNRKLRTDELGRLTNEQFKGADKIPVTVVLDDVRSALNVGSVFRTADAFAIEKIILCGITATPPNREINKTAIGATESVDWEYASDVAAAIDKLRSDGYNIVAVEQTSHSQTFGPYIPVKGKTAVIFGNEVEGVSESVILMADVCIDIPQFGTKHSLNVSVCAGIVLWEMRKIYGI